MCESINYQLRKISKTRGHFPNDDALVKLLYLGCKELGRTDIRGREGRGGRSNYNCKVALNQFDIMFPAASTGPDQYQPVTRLHKNADTPTSMRHRHRPA